MAQIERALGTLLELQGQLGPRLVGKRSFLEQLQAKIGYGDFGSDEEIDVKPVRGLRVNEFAILAGVFHARAHAAPEAFVRLRIDAVVIGADRREVNKARRSEEHTSE